MIVFGQGGCIRAKMVVLRQKWLYSKKSGCTRANLLYSDKSGCVRGKVVVIGRKRFYSGTSGCITAKEVVFG